MRKFFLLVVILLSAAISNAQVQETWAVSHIGWLQDQVVDANGNVYTTGMAFSEAFDTYGNLTIKHDKNGIEKWRYFAPNFWSATAMAVDGLGNVYVAGATGVEAGVPSSPRSISVDNSTHFFLLKISATGIFQWSNTYEEDDFGVYGYPEAIAIDMDGIPYVTGTLFLAFINPDVPRDMYPDSTTADYCTIKYDPASGNPLWVKRYNGSTAVPGFDGSRGITTDAIGFIYVTGSSELNGELDIVTVKYDPAGNQLWAQRYSNPDPNYKKDLARGVKLDIAGNVIVGGYSQRNSSRINDQTLLIKYTFSGFQLWAKTPITQTFTAHAGFPNLDIPFVIDNANNIIDLGLYSGSDFVTYGLVKYNASGEVQWVANNYAQELATDADNNIYAVSAFSSLMRTQKISSSGTQLWSKEYAWSGSHEWVGLDAEKNVYCSDGGYSFTNPTYVTVRYSQCEIACPSNITVNAAAGTCGAVVTYPAATTSGYCGSEITYSHASGSTFPVGTTTVTVRSTATGAECSFTITVNDNQNPVITNCPTSKSVNTSPGVCYATAANVNAGTATATDNCSVTVEGVRSDGLALTANYSVGATTIKWTATDPSSNTSTCSQTITVVDNVPPTINGESASTYVLSPPNHTMRDVTINYTATDNCAVTATISVTSNEPINGVGDGDTDPDWVIIDKNHVQLRAERSAAGSGRIYTITITAIDPSGNVATKTIEVKVPHNIKNPHSGKAFIVGSTVPFEGEFWDKPGKTHTAKWVIDESATAKAIVTEPSGNKNGKITGSYKFTAPGVYKLQMNITDQTGLTTYTNTAGDLEAIVVIYDPNGGNAYGGGYFNSPAGALRSNPSATGKASYGFAMNYFKNSTNPKGETQFEFKVGSFEFNALNFEYLVISNSMAQFKGTGKIIGGQSGVGFTMTVVDGQLDGTGVDKIRMKIYNKNNGSVIYDNQFGASDATLPTQPVGSNSVIVISGANASMTKSNNATQGTRTEAAEVKIPNGLDVIAYPNPSTSNFSITVQSNSKEKTVMQVVDMYGRVIETRNVSANSIVKFGERYRSGTYFVRVIQGKDHKEIKLIKLIN